MSSVPVWVYITVMALVTYLIRAVPFTLVRRQIRSRFIRSLLFYMPYAVLSAMTVPAIFSSTGSLISGIAGCAAAVFFAFRGKGLLFVACSASVCAFCADFICNLL